MLHTEEAIDAEFVEETPAQLDVKPFIRRTPTADLKPSTRPNPSITMKLDKWLDVDRTMHELYGLCEIAIMQRDQVKAEVSRSEAARLNSDLRNEKLGARISEWKTYAKKLETMLHEARIETLELRHESQRIRYIAEEAVEAGAMGGKTRKRLKKRLDR